MAIKEERKFEEEKKNGMKIVDNLDGDKKANEKLMASATKEFSDLEVLQLKKLGYGKALKNPSIISSKGRNMGIKILKDILKVNQQR
tara:strand:- start:218 stop:478 length:261 start_codon:yes stop_codon:yes gene_type:complete